MTLVFDNRKETTQNVRKKIYAFLISRYSVLCFPCLQAILEANARGHKLIIMDARPKINALANQVSSVKNI